MVKTLILNKGQIDQKIRRIAFEIYENNFEEKEIIFAGILEMGFAFANKIAKELNEISKIKATVIQLKVDKFAPTQSEVSLSCDSAQIKNKPIIIMDDVLNTGRTVAHCLKPFLNIEVKKIETAFLVNRSHISFPISSKYTGYQVSTMLNDHIEVILEGQEAGVYLH